jgi:Carboxypeptidase regulatory-like domain
MADSPGAAIVGAHFTITETATGTARSVLTNSLGSYSVPNLQPSQYSVAVIAQDFSPKSQTASLSPAAQPYRELFVEGGQLYQRSKGGWDRRTD